MRRFTSLVVGTSFGLLCAVAACSSPSSGSGPVSLEQLPAQYATKICESLAPCCQANGTPYSGATCQQTAQAALSATITKLNKATVVYNASAAGACLDAYASTLRGCSETAIDSQALVTACNAVFTGTLPAGAVCTLSEECLKPAGGQAYCNIDTVASTGSGGASGASSGGSSGGGSGGAMGTCVQEVPSPHGKAGDACAGDCTATTSSVGCSGSAVPGTDTAATALCYRNEGLYCATSAPTTGTPAITQVCRPIGAIGSACSGNGCVDGAFCNAGTCAAQYDSGTCGAGFSDACSSKSYCDYANAYLCVPRLADGAACTSGDTCLSNYCQYPADSSSSGGTSPPAGGGGGGGGGAGLVMRQGVCVKETFATPKVCAGNLD